MDELLFYLAKELFALSASDSGTGTETVRLAVIAADAASGAETWTITVSAADAGTGTDTGLRSMQVVFPVRVVVRGAGGQSSTLLAGQGAVT
jgi:hypothetical protein